MAQAEHLFCLCDGCIVYLGCTEDCSKDEKVYLESSKVMTNKVSKIKDAVIEKRACEERNEINLYVEEKY